MLAPTPPTGTLGTGTLILIRHGETAHNAGRRFQGHSDTPLSEVGKSQARSIAAHLHGLGLREPTIYTSDLRRARTTAAPLHERVGGTLTETPDLREINLGDWEGRTLAELQAEQPDEVEQFWGGRYDFRAPGGESPQEVAEHVHAFTLKHWPRSGETVVLVFHGLAITALLCRLLRLEYAQEWPAKRLMHLNTAYSRLTVGDVGEVLKADIALSPHLQGLKAQT